jgi:hypothetical protein
MFRASSVPIIRSYQLYMWHLVCFMQVMWSLPRRVRLEPDSPRQRPHNLHETYQVPSVQLITPDDGHSRCPKHVEFRDKNKCWILDASCWLFIYTKLITMHGHLNIRHVCMCIYIYIYSKRDLIVFGQILKTFIKFIHSSYSVFCI